MLSIWSNLIFCLVISWIPISKTVNLPFTNRVAFVTSEDQDQSAQNVQPDLPFKLHVHCVEALQAKGSDEFAIIMV